MSDQTIGRRLKALRLSQKLSQERMCEILGLNDRQSVSQIEVGQRAVKAEELIRAIAHFDVPLADITNPFLLFEKESFSWRQNRVPLEDLDRFERQAGEWIGAYRELTRLTGETLPAIMPRLGLTYESAFEDAVAFGEKVARELDLALYPAHGLAQTLEDRYGILVLMVDTLPNISGAACRLPELNAILINRHESEGRRNSDLAHEFFHLLTWDTMKPERVESSDSAPDVAPATAKGRRNQRIERLADNFAQGLLIPTSTLEALGQPPQHDLTAWLLAAADRLGVTAKNLKWRLVNSGWAPAVAAVDNEALARAARDRGLSDPPAPFSKAFMRTLALALDKGHISARRAAALLEITVEDLADLCVLHGVERPAGI
jgi:transcriptional regulator with XRE-family HTH domain/Zn-dependent peptidase ImmA (M78 family)